MLRPRSEEQGENLAGNLNTQWDGGRTTGENEKGNCLRKHMEIEFADYWKRNTFFSKEMWRIFVNENRRWKDIKYWPGLESTQHCGRKKEKGVWFRVEPNLSLAEQPRHWLCPFQVCPSPVTKSPFGAACQSGPCGSPAVGEASFPRRYFHYPR